MNIPLYRALIIDDEPLARSRLATLIRTRNDIEIAAECANGLEALSAIDTLKPDLLLLDIQMPELNGFELLESLSLANVSPLTIFVTAFDQYAINAFEKNALDYILKPVDPVRLNKALDRAIETITDKQQAVTQTKMLQILQEIYPPPKKIEKIVVRDSGKARIVNVDDIDWIESDGNYITLHVKQNEHLLRETMKNIESRLDPMQFIRIHRTRIVNIDRIQEFYKGTKNEIIIVLNDGTHLRMSQRYWEKFNTLIGNYL